MKRIALVLFVLFSGSYAYAQSIPVTKADLEQLKKDIIFHMDTRIEAVNARIDAINTRIDAVQAVLSQEIKAGQAVLSQEIKTTQKEINFMQWIGAFLILGMFIPMCIAQWRNALALRIEKPQKKLKNIKQATQV